MNTTTATNMTIPRTLKPEPRSPRPELRTPNPEPRNPKPETEPGLPEPIPCADEGWVEDCTGKCSLDSWRGDGWCDDADSPFGADFDCASLSFDLGDCPH